MALVYNLDNNKFLKNRLQYHAASRVGISVNQALAQATNVDGHTVTDSQIWTAKNNEFPKNRGANKTTSDGVAATNDLVEVFKNGNQYQVTPYILTSDSVFKQDKKYFVKKVDQQTNKVTYEEATVVVNEAVTLDTYYEPTIEGKIYRNDDYPAVELYEAVQMNDVEYSDKQAWQVKVDGSRIMNWIAPTSVMDNGVPVPGFSGIVQIYGDTGNSGATVASQRGKWTIIQKSAANSYAWQLTKGTWQFVSMSGMLIFHPDYLPSSQKYSKIRITAFKYIGKYLNTSINEVDNRITNIQTQFGTQLSNIGQTLMAVKPFEWNAETYMTYIYNAVTSPVVEDITKYYELVDDAYVITKDTVIDENKTYFVKTTSKEVIIPAILFNVFNTATGLAFGDIEYQSDGSTRVVFEDWDNADFTNTNFIGYGFVLGNGSKITMLDLEELKNESSSSSASE